MFQATNSATQSESLHNADNIAPAFLVDTKNRITKEINGILNLGTAPECQIQLKGDCISPRHARIEISQGRHIIRDLRSQTGTLVNNTKVIEAFLTDGDIIDISGSHFLFSSGQLKVTLPTSKNPSWNHQLQNLPMLAATNHAILITGPTGTGKDLLAQMVHKFSTRSSCSLISVNCSALSETLIESELFGHIKGSFTGAIADRKGAFEAARGGTLFLDEVGDLPLSVQAKLLRALENNEIRPVGSDLTVITNVRIIAATHQNLEKLIQEGKFRSDLYYRLNILKIKAPSLFERPEDFEDLLFHFAKEMRVRFSYAASELLKKHAWPGNIRELKNTVARASALFRGKLISEDDILSIVDPMPIAVGHQPPAELANLYEGGGTKRAADVIRNMEKKMILEKLALNHGNQRRTAIELGMPKSTLNDRLRQYGINPKQFVSGMISLTSV